MQQRLIEANPNLTVYTKTERRLGAYLGQTRRWTLYETASGEPRAALNSDVIVQAGLFASLEV